jgi:hypothetical protein
MRERSRLQAARPPVGFAGHQKLYIAHYSSLILTLVCSKIKNPTISVNLRHSTLIGLLWHVV